jgi:small glutamine-rich tetratricopeptide repeat-containing protein alpha
MSEKQQRLVLSIIDFLNQSINDGTIKSDDKESLEVASTPPPSCLIQLLSNLAPVQCIGEAFGVDPSNGEQVEKLSVKPTTLQSIFDVYMKTLEKVGARTQPADTQASKAPTAEDKAEAEKLKQEGNALMSSKKYDEAVEMYNKAIALDGSNPVFYSNRAAAYSSKGDHLAAIGDANSAIKVDASFSKAYHRLG